MTPLDYARVVVLPTLQEALAHRGDHRRVYLACIVVFHLADYIATAEAQQAPEFATATKRASR